MANAIGCLLSLEIREALFEGGDISDGILMRGRNNHTVIQGKSVQGTKNSPTIRMNVACWSNSSTAGERRRIQWLKTRTGRYSRHSQGQEGRSYSNCNEKQLANFKQINDIT